RPIDPPFTVLTARTSRGRAVARLAHFPCHPVVLDATNRKISGDYPTHVRNALDDDGGTTVFVTGCAGDVNTGHSAEDSLSPAIDQGRTAAEAERVGKRLAQQAHEAPARRLRADKLRVVSQDVTLAFDISATAAISN